MAVAKQRLSAQQRLTGFATCLHDRARKVTAEPAIELLVLLLDGPRDVGSLARAIQLDIGAVSRRLAELREAGLVSVRMDGSRRVYQIADEVEVQDLGHAIALLTRVDGGFLVVGISRELLDDLREDPSSPPMVVQTRVGSARKRQRDGAPSNHRASGNKDEGSSRDHSA